MIGGIVAAFGLLVRAAASGHLRKDEELATAGPYASTRNPLYLGSAFLAAGFIIAGNSWWAGLIVGVYFAVFYYAVIRNEEEDLRKRFGATFEAYAARVPLFFPSFQRFERRSIVAARDLRWERVLMGAVSPESRVSGAAGDDWRTRNRVAANVGSSAVGLLNWRAAYCSL